MQKPDVFVSYKREERDLANLVSHALVEAGYVAVTDLNIQKATDFGDAIDHMIRQASLVLVLWTEASTTSQWVRKEANEAERLNKYMGVRIDPVSSEALPLQVRNSNWIDLSGEGVTRGLPELISEVNQIIGAPARSKSKAKDDSRLVEKDLEFYQIVSEIGDVGGFEKYIQIYPDGAYVSDARTKIESFKAKADQQFYKDISDIGAVGGYRRYVAQFPQGAFLEDAKFQIQRNTGWRAIVRKIPVFSIIAAIGTGVAAFVALYPAEVESVSDLESKIVTLSSTIAEAEGRIERLTSERDVVIKEREQLAEALRLEQNAIIENESTNIEIDEDGRLVGAIFEPYSTAAAQKFGLSRHIDSGVVTVDLLTSSPFFAAGLRQGDHFSVIGNRNVASKNDVKRALIQFNQEGRDEVMVHVNRRGSPISFFIPVPNLNLESNVKPISAHSQ